MNRAGNRKLNRTGNRQVNWTGNREVNRTGNRKINRTGKREVNKTENRQFTRCTGMENTTIRVEYKGYTVHIQYSAEHIMQYTTILHNFCVSS